VSNVFVQVPVLTKIFKAARLPPGVAASIARRLLALASSPGDGRSILKRALKFVGRQDTLVGQIVRPFALKVADAIYAGSFSVSRRNFESLLRVFAISREIDQGRIASELVRLVGAHCDPNRFANLCSFISIPDPRVTPDLRCAIEPSKSEPPPGLGEILAENAERIRQLIGLSRRSLLRCFPFVAWLPELASVEDRFRAIEVTLKQRKRLKVRRDRLLEMSRAKLLRPKFERGGAILLKVEFVGEGGIDIGGLRSEWISLLSDIFISRIEIRVIAPTPNGDRFRLFPGASHPDLLFFGRFVGLCLKTKENCGISLHSALLRQMRGESVCLQDCEDYDQELYRGLKSVIDTQGIDAAGLTFPSGDPVDDGNKREYVRLKLEQIFVKEVAGELRPFLGGFHNVFPVEKANLFLVHELRKRLTSAVVISVNELRAMCTFSCRLEPKIEQKAFFDVFFGILEKWSQDELRALLQFATGMTKLPVDGLGMIGGPVMTIVLDRAGTGAYPEGHTCSRQLSMPRYKTPEIMEQKLKEAIRVVEFTRS
jgi:hypothetical protein